METNVNFLSETEKQAKEAVKELLSKCRICRGFILVVGCSSSEVVGGTIGKNSNYETAQAIFGALWEICKENSVFLAAQCCEHLNRAIVIERCALQYLNNFTEVNVIPQIKAGGSFATSAYNSFSDPVVIEEIEADAGLDIGLTLIGMHLKRVAVPIRLQTGKIGCATVTAAKTRPKYIGGARAVYKEEL